MAPHNTLQNKLESLRLRFLDALPEHEHEIASAWADWCQRGWDAATSDRLQLRAHRLAGSSALFGLPALGDAARELDQCIGELTAEPNPGQHEQIARRVNDLLAALRRPATAAPTESLAAVSAVEQPLLFLVDDDRDLTDLVSLHLRAAGYRVTVFDSPAACLAALDTVTPTAVVMDVSFPEGSLAGIETVSAIRGRSGAAIPVLFISARNDLDARLRALRAGGYGYLHKPFDLEALTAAVAGAIQEAAQPSLKVLVVDDDADAAHYYAALLDSTQFQTQVLLQPELALGRMREFRPDVMLIDLRMPSLGGDELAALVIESELDFGCAVLLLTADASEGARARSVALGASGFLSKPVSAELLAQTVRGAARAARRRSARVRAVTQHASGSRLLRRAAFLARLETVLAQARSVPAALLYAGIDQTEALARQYGNLALVALNEQLIALAEDLARTEEDWTALADSVLAVIVRNADEATARAEALRARIQQTAFTIGGSTLRCTASVAVVPLSAEMRSLRASLTLAERGEREARLAGGNRVQAAPDRGRLEPARKPTDIESVLAQTVLGLQPIVSIDNDQPTLFDALLRLREAGVLRNAQQFLPNLLAEGYADRLDQRVIELAGEFLASGVVTPLAIRLSREGLERITRLPGLAQAVKPSGVPGQPTLLVQCDEEWLLLQPEAAEASLRQLRQLGIGCLLSGYGNARNPEVVARFGPFAFARLGERVDPAAIPALIERADRQSCKVIASHVEDAQRLSRLWQLGVRLFQGNFIEQPQPRPTNTGGSAQRG